MSNPTETDATYSVLPADNGMSSLSAPGTPRLEESTHAITRTASSTILIDAASPNFNSSESLRNSFNLWCQNELKTYRKLTFAIKNKENLLQKYQIIHDTPDGITQDLKSQFNPWPNPPTSIDATIIQKTRLKEIELMNALKRSIFENRFKILQDDLESTRFQHSLMTDITHCQSTISAAFPATPSSTVTIWAIDLRAQILHLKTSLNVTSNTKTDASSHQQKEEHNIVSVMQKQIDSLTAQLKNISARIPPKNQRGSGLNTRKASPNGQNKRKQSPSRTQTRSATPPRSRGILKRPSPADQHSKRDRDIDYGKNNSSWTTVTHRKSRERSVTPSRNTSPHGKRTSSQSPHKKKVFFDSRQR
jgi:hypothetical protein